MAAREEDIFRQCRIKMLRWVKDSKDLYEMAELPANDCLRALFFILIHTVVGLSTKVGFEKQSYMELCEHVWEMYHEQRRQQDQSEGDQ